VADRLACKTFADYEASFVLTPVNVAAAFVPTDVKAPTESTASGKQALSVCDGDLQCPAGWPSSSI
jgi:hypothetical protein